VSTLSTADGSVILDRFSGARRYSCDGFVAPNKSVTLFWALDRIGRGARRLTPFGEAEAELRELLDGCGRPGTSAGHAFWRLQNDGFWEVSSPVELPVRSGGGEPPIAALRAHASGGFEASVHRRLATDPDLREEAQGRLIDELFGDEALPAEPSGQTVETVRRLWSLRLERRKAFRLGVMAAYGSCCAVCGWSFVHRGRPVGLAAAHVRPLAARGPDAAGNGMVLCALHHELFDVGLFTYDVKRRLIVAGSWQEGASGDMQSLHRHAGRVLPEPRDPAWRVHGTHLAWHRRHVFVGA